MLNFVKPVIERRLEGPEECNQTRISLARDICQFLEVASPSAAERARFYNACESLLGHEESRRILLYLPFETLCGAPESFKEAYKNAWYSLLDTQDVRENFHEGDCLELDARPRGGLERVVKCLHLVPWLLGENYLDIKDLIDILRDNRGNEVLLRSLKDTINCLHAYKIIDDADERRLRSLTASVPDRPAVVPLYVSQKRKKWLDERSGQAAALLTPDADLAGPFSRNLATIGQQIEEIQEHLSSSEIVLVGGSALKGYGTVDSDLDIWTLRQLETDPVFYPGSAHAVHVYFNTIWVGGSEVDNLPNIADGIRKVYADSVLYASNSFLRLRAIERLESDLLQYRLLHKGFLRFTGEKECPTFYFSEMDGDCPFYDEDYRKLATRLYAKYVWL